MVVNCMYKRIISLFFSFVILFSCVSLAHADYVSDYTGANFWDWRMIRLNHVASTTDLGGLVQGVTGTLSGKVCSLSPDSFHHSDTKGQFGHVSGGSDENGRFIWLTCKYCEKQFKCYSADFQQSYDTQVSELPASAYGSSGELRWRLNIDRIKSYEYNGRGSLVSSRVGSEYSVILDTKNCSGPGFVSGYFSKNLYQ